MLLQGRVLGAELVKDALDLCVEALPGRREKTSEAELVTLLIREAGVLIWERIRDNAMVSGLSQGGR